MVCEDNNLFGCIITDGECYRGHYTHKERTLRQQRASDQRRKVRANPPVCWLCDKKLDGAGWWYGLIVGEDGNKHPAHRHCIRANHLIAVDEDQEIG